METDIHILRHYKLLALTTHVETMHASPVRVQISLSGLLPAGIVRAGEESGIAIFIDMGLDMASWENLRASSIGERAPHTNFVAHINE